MASTLEKNIYYSYRFSFPPFLNWQSFSVFTIDHSRLTHSSQFFLTFAATSAFFQDKYLACKKNLL
jgi:hypothetical protein